ncbi:lipid II flippase family protein [Effusibacillus consociatus]|uniref:Lipid II flippase family protein n=1 Tax=Effusibacillus consociatus TaxID=1117041 RepID=A0ABV9PZK1_9BACL
MNGLAMILLVIFVDPKIALLTEQVMEGRQERREIDKIVGLLMLSRLLGTILAQALLVPAAYWIVWICPLFHVK